MRLAKSFLVAVILSGVVAACASAAVQDPDRNSAARTGWHWYHGVSAAFVNGKIAANKERIVSLHVESKSPYRFTVALVRNKGTYARVWHWFYGVGAKGLNKKIKTFGDRIVDIERYKKGGKQRFAAVLVHNSGKAAKSWWWYHGLKASQVVAKLNAHNARLIDIDSWGSGSSRRFAVVMIKNSGVDATSWWWYHGATGSFVASKIKQHKARLIDLDRTASGRFNAIMVRNKGKNRRFWVYGFGTNGQINDFVGENVARIVDIEAYFKNGQKRFFVVAIDNADADGRRLRGIMRSGWREGLFGAYLKKVGGRVFTGILRNRIFEPASALKALPHLYAIHEVEVDPAHNHLDTTFLPYNSCPGSPDPADSGMCAGQAKAKDICPTNPAASQTYRASLSVTLQRMMQNSDNRETRAVVDHYGRGPINAYADQHGIGANTEIRQVFGCGFDNGLRNDWTLVDAGKLYEGVLNGTLITQQANRDSFFNLMSTGGPNDAINQVIDEEAAKQGKSADADDFRSQVVISNKGGSYDIVPCIPGSPASCVLDYYRTRAGRITLPYKSGGQTVLRSFVYGFFVNDLSMPCGSSGCAERTAADASFSKMGSEILRAAIRDALKSW